MIWLLVLIGHLYLIAMWLGMAIIMDRNRHVLKKDWVIFSKYDN
jgi:hypothetical protein